MKTLLLSSKWTKVQLREILREVDVRAKDLGIQEGPDAPVLSLTKDRGLILQSERFDKRIATDDVSKYKVVKRGWVTYNPYVIWEGAVHALHDRDLGLVSPVYPVWEVVDADFQFLDFLLKTPLLLEAYIRFSSGTVKRRRSISKQSFLSIEITLPPLPEQRAIASALRSVQEAKAARQREVALEREHKAALMQYLFTHGTRGEARKETEIGEIPESWEVVTLEHISEFFQYGTSKRCDTDDCGIPVLRIPNIIGGRIDTADLKYIHLEDKETRSLELEVGDLLFVRTNGNREYTGRCAVFKGELPKALFASYLIRARLKADVVAPEFIQLYAMTRQGREFLAGKASSAADGKFNINTQTLRSVLLPLPSRTEQREIVALLEACETKIAVIEQEIILLDELFRAMLEELMTGRLSALPLVGTEAESAGALPI